MWVWLLSFAAAHSMHRLCRLKHHYCDWCMCGMSKVRHIDSPRDTGKDASIKAYTNEILSTIREIVKINAMFREHVQYFVQTADLQDSWKLVG